MECTRTFSPRMLQRANRICDVHFRRTKWRSVQRYPLIKFADRGARGKDQDGDVDAQGEGKEYHSRFLGSCLSSASLLYSIQGGPSGQIVWLVWLLLRLFHLLLDSAWLLWNGQKKLCMHRDWNFFILAWPVNIRSILDQNGLTGQSRSNLVKWNYLNQSSNNDFFWHANIFWAINKKVLLFNKT